MNQTITIDLTENACRNCCEGSIQSNGHCDLCGFDEIKFVMEYEQFLDSEEPTREQDYDEWAKLQVPSVDDIPLLLEVV